METSAERPPLEPLPADSSSTLIATVDPANALPPNRWEDALLEQVNQKDAILGALADGIMVFDLHMRMLHANPAARAMLGLDTRPLYANLPLADRIALMRPSDATGQILAQEEWPVARILAGAQITGADAEDVRLRRPDGRAVVVSVTGAPICSATGDILAAVCVLRDVTERRKLESERWQMFNLVSHELKTPVTSMKILAQYVTRHLTDEEHPDADNLRKILHDIERITRLADDLGLAARLEQDQLTLDRQFCDLSQICRDNAQELERVAGRSLTLTLPPYPVMGSFDATRVSQIITNLVNNAFKYTPPDAEVCLSLRACGHIARIEVRDTGLGIAPDALLHIFDRFYRVPGAPEFGSGMSLGLGLGLSICQALVTAHGGKIDVDSVLGAGTTFWFTLPLV